MALLTKEEAKIILDKVLSFSTADECEVTLGGSNSGNIRYARNTVSTAGMKSDLELAVRSTYGKKSGVATTNELDKESLKRVVERSEELAKLAPENPEYMPLEGPHEYKPTPMYTKATAEINPEFRAKVAETSITMAEKNDLVAAGFLEDEASFEASANSKGLFAYEESTSMDFTLTVRSKDGTGSGWVRRDFNDVSKFDIEKATSIAVQKATDSRNAKAIEPGKYTVILEPAASADLIRNMGFNMSARSADEGRSFMSKRGGGTKIGEKMFDERVTIYSDPWHPEVPASAISGDGLPREKTMWVENGVVKNLFRSRYWADKNGEVAMPRPSNMIMVGGDKSTQELIESTEKGILVTRLWYIRSVDPQTLLYTGLTRDGTFYIENGKIKFPIKNMRFNESPVIMLNNIEDLGKPVRFDGKMIPPMKIRDFTFTSLSDAI
ncbi:TldD/PmbA family protein [Sediminitomix flava]|uniref:Putative Zn-dependent protease n=1 Tax=Sediminitomix flava TaxID=379075 RepID=A0A315ZCX9_SEDFL|nr:TldD/PmbA family protein [Sediminitomix flava]PWJ42953.1 putative Zn-dependent protease [Sediminitomix flava]